MASIVSYHMVLKSLTTVSSLFIYLAFGLTRAKNWRSHNRPWRVKPDQGHQKLRSERPMCDYATEFRKFVQIMRSTKLKIKLDM